MRSKFSSLTIIATIILVFLSSLSFSQDSQTKNEPNYKKSWEKVDSLQKKGLYRMALEEVHGIFEMSTNNKDHNQVIKSVLFELQFNSMLEEDDYIIGIARLESLIKEVPSPSKEILHSLLAEVYWGYYSGNMWKYNGRTAGPDLDLKDIRTWDLRRIAEQIRINYGKSLLNATVTQAKNISQYEEIISLGALTESIRPTLFDFLGHRALDFFKSSTFEISGPAKTFVLDQPGYFYSNSTFLKMNAATQDSLNTRFLAIQVMHALTDFNVRNNKLEPAFYLELERLNFALQHSTDPNKNKLYLEGIERMASAYKGYPFAAEAWYEKAKYHSNLGNSYRAFRDTTSINEKRKAYQLCIATIENYPNSFGSQQCQSLISSLEEKQLSLKGNEVTIPNRVSKFLLTYKNMDKVHLKLVKVDYEKMNSNRYSGEKLYEFLRKEKGMYGDKVDLTNPMDYNGHSIELELPSLTSGAYYLVVCSNETFEKSETGMAFVPILVNSITYQHRNVGSKSHLLVSDRLTGKPLIGAKVKISRNKYNYTLRRYESKTLGNYTSDSEGKVSFPAIADYATLDVSIKYRDETSIPLTAFYSHPNQNHQDNGIQTHLFTDRKLYRPGQKIYFKGILIQLNGKERELVKNYETEVDFYDVNGQIVKTEKVKTNKFGSFEGTFDAPFSALTGLMSIRSMNGITNFRVEEYKRPKFGVAMQPIEGEFRVNDSIDAKGIATAFAGNKIDGGAVKYRIERVTRYNYNYWWGWRPFTAPKEVANGELVTDEDGVFNIRFKAIPDEESDPNSLPVFTYTIYADVTDINGETRSTTTSIMVGYQSLVLQNNCLADMNNQNDFYLRLSTSNLNGQVITANGKVKIEKLKMPDTPVYERLWNRPDMQNLSKETFNSKFPNAAYGDENNQSKWQVEEIAFETNFDTKITDSIAISDYKNWNPGAYRYTATAKDKNGILVEDITYFTVFNPDKKITANNDVLWLKSLKNKAEPGETASILLASKEMDLLLYYDIEANGELIKTGKLILSNEQQKFDFEIKEEHRGNVTVSFSAVKNNRHFQETFVIQVPYTNKQLDVNFATFRNKLLPGQAEEWILTVKNKLGEKEQAELLATLYDASLDELYTPNSFYMNVYKTFYGNKQWSAPNSIGISSGNNLNYYWNNYISMPHRYYPSLNYFGWSSYYYGSYYNRGMYLEDDIMESSSGAFEDEDSMELEETVSDKVGEVQGYLSTNSNEVSKRKSEKMQSVNAPVEMELGAQDNTVSDKEGDLENIAARSNFNETAFFYPQLNTNDKGEIEVKFTIPESLTKWRFLGLAHTEDLKFGTITEEVVTQKELMVVPNAPRFLREGDVITIAAKISNISEEDLAGKAQLYLYDPFTEELIDSKFELMNPQIEFSAEKGKSTTVSWKLKVPYTQSAVKYKIVAKAGSFSDGEENVLPILSNRMMVTESLPLPIRGEETKTFKFEKLLQSKTSKTLKNHRYTVEFTSNPAWYAIQAMPYMMEYPHECAEQTFTRYYSNAIASHIMNSNPKVRKVVEDWGSKSPEAFLSNLQKNQELKAVILEETPWVLDAKNEEASKRNLAVLLDMGRMSRELDKALSKTIKTQSSNGGWPWFPGMRENRYITQHIVTGMGHLDHLGIKDIRDDRKVWSMIQKAVNYLDGEIVRDYKRAKKWDKEYLKKQHISYSQIQYLYARSYFPEIGMNSGTREAVNYYKDQAKMYWLNFNLYAEGMIGLAADRFDMKDLSSDIVKSLKDRSINHEEFGMYWKDYKIGYYWYQAPIETQALMIELFDEVAQDQSAVEELKIWLLKQKQTTNWKTTKQTTEAVYALLLKGTDLLAADDLVKITVGGKEIQYKDEPAVDDPYEVNAQSGTGYFKTAWDANAIVPEMGEIKVSKTTTGVAWGAAYWQYFEDLDKITFAETNLKLEKELFVVDVTSRGEELKSITVDNALKVGDKIRVRIVLRTDRNMEYVHMKDMRASGFEPIDVLSYYHYQDGLGYYQSTKDAATHFFFDYIPKGTYVFEYDLRVQHKGDFSNGITSIQCMYAPEFTAHSKGVRVVVE